MQNWERRLRECGRRRKLAPRESRGRLLVYWGVGASGGGIGAYLAGLVIDGSVVASEAETSLSLSLVLVLAWCLLKAAAAPRATKVLGKHGARALARRVFAHHGRTYCLLFKFSAIRKYLPSFYGSCLLACLPSVCARFIYKKYSARTLPPQPPSPARANTLLCVCVRLSHVCSGKHSLDWEKR